MSMKLLIVDDEYEILTWLEEMFRYDFDPPLEVCTASSAYEAINWLNRVNFDVVLTDIKMPGMDGLTLFQKIKANWPRCKTIFLTGYPNFEDVYQIIRHKDVRYILKSEDDEVIMKTVREALEEQQAEMEQEILRQKHSQDMDKVREWMRQDFLNNLLLGDYDTADPAALAQQAREAGVKTDLSRPFLLLAARIDPEHAGEARPEQEKALADMMNQSIRISLPAGIRAELCADAERWTAGFVQAETQPDADMNRIFALVKGAFEYAQSFFEKLSGRSFSAVVSSTPLNGRDAPAVFFRMKQILRGSLGREKAVVAHVEAMQIPEAKSGGMSMSRIQLLKNHLELRQRDAFFSILDEVCAELLACAAPEDPRGLGLYYSTAVTLLQFIQDNRLEERLLPQTGLYKLTRMDAHRSWQEAARFLCEVSSAVFDVLDAPDSALSDRALKRVCDYIDQYPERDLSLTRLAEIGGFNASYLSRVFKQKYGMNVSDYVTQKRMRLAALLLETTGDRIQTIAEKTGYLSSQSFARAFKNYYAASAAEYREIHQKHG